MKVVFGSLFLFILCALVSIFFPFSIVPTKINSIPALNESSFSKKEFFMLSRKNPQADNKDILSHQGRATLLFYIFNIFIFRIGEANIAYALQNNVSFSCGKSTADAWIDLTGSRVPSRKISLFELKTKLHFGNNVGLLIDSDQNQSNGQIKTIVNYDCE